MSFKDVKLRTQATVIEKGDIDNVCEVTVGGSASKATLDNVRMADGASSRKPRIPTQKLREERGSP